MTRRPLRLAGHALVVSKRVTWARASRRARRIVPRIEDIMGVRLEQWQREVVVHHLTVVVHHFPLDTVRSMRVDPVTS